MGYQIVSTNRREQPVYAADNVTDADEVAELIRSIRRQMGLDKMNKTRIFVLSGTHGDEAGNLTAEKGFFYEDKDQELQTVTAVNVNETTPFNTWNRYFSQEKAIIILAWCYSARWNQLGSFNK